MNKLKIDWMDANFINLMYYENRIFNEIMDNNRDGFTDLFKITVKNFLYDIANSKNFDFYRKNYFNKVQK